MINIIIGTKAQIIKMAPIIRILDNKHIKYNLMLTGQHRETTFELYRCFKIRKADIILYEGKDITGIFQMFIWMLKIITKTALNNNRLFGDEIEGGVVLVHGDTFSTLLGAILGKMAGKKVAHIEAGLRSFDLFNPFPEEITRILTSKLSDVHFCPGSWAMDTLTNYDGQKINTYANTLYDSLMLASKESSSTEIEIPSEKFGLVSIHRFENIFRKSQLTKICYFLEEISRSVNLLFILHLPTKKQLDKYALYDRLESAQGIHLRPRYDYFNFIQLLHYSEFLITDGGSNQEEAYYMGKPTLLFRKKTERKEGIGENIVISKFDSHIIHGFILNYEQYKRPLSPLQTSPSKVIVDFLVSDQLQQQTRRSTADKPA